MLIRRVEYALKRDHNVYIGPGRENLERSPLAPPWKMRLLRDTPKERARLNREYKVWLWDKMQNDDPVIWKALRQIRESSVLNCHCYPKLCHGAVVACAWMWAHKQGLIDQPTDNHDGKTFQNIAAKNAELNRKELGNYDIKAKAPQQYKVDADAITDFHGKHWYLSNFSKCQVELDGNVYPSVEHAFQAAKTTIQAERMKVRMQKTPGEAKRIGRKVALRPDWEKVKDGIMLDLLRQKFNQTMYRNGLLSTGQRQLVEGNTWNDTYWGICNGIGQNKLGELLMQIRHDWQTDATARTVEEVDAIIAAARTSDAEQPRYLTAAGRAEVTSIDWQSVFTGEPAATA